MTDEYMQIAMQNAEFGTLKDGGVYAEIPGLKGVWADGGSVPAVRAELGEVLREWVDLRLSKNLDVPKVGGASEPSERERRGEV